MASSWVLFWGTEALASRGAKAGERNLTALTRASVVNLGGAGHREGNGRFITSY
jgi:hypothetical protein